MTQTALIEPGQGGYTSGETTVASGDRVTVGLFSEATSNTIPPGVICTLRASTPGNPVIFGYLGGSNPRDRVMQVSGPMSFVVERPDISKWEADVGVFIDTGA